MTETTADLFGFTAKQGDLFATQSRGGTGAVQPDPGAIRLRLHKMLAEARAAQTSSPWNERTTRAYQQVFPQMANWLPEDEAGQFRLEFESELRRLSIAA